VARYPRPEVAEAGDTAAVLEQVKAELGIGAGTVLEGQQMVEMIEGMLRQRAHPDYETVMVPMEGPDLVYDGVPGFREALTDWLSPWEEFRFEVEELITLEDKILLLVRQRGRTRHGGVEVETESGTIWWAEDNRIRRATFYLDRQAARKAAGIV
jgi:ketosteroid isomerase-like protein